MLKTMVMALAVLVPVQAYAQSNAVAVCYSCPEEWADWGTELRAIRKATGVSIPTDSKNSGQALSQIIAEKDNPVADFANLGITFGIQAHKLGLTQPYKPPHFDEIPAELKDPDGHWFAIHTGAIGFFVNKDALGDHPVPQSWADLLKPEYAGIVGYYDPTSAFVGYVSGMAINLAMGGTIDDFTPAMTYYQNLRKNQPIVVNQTSYARVLSGEIPILVDADFNAYRAKYKDEANVVFVLPKEGSLAMPYVITLVKNAPHPEAARKAIDFLLSDEGQAVWANAYLHPVRPEALTAETAAKFLPASEYAQRVRPVDFVKVAAAQKPFATRYLADVH